MKIKCTNKKEFKNLTLEKEYKVVREDGEFYVINNDSEAEARYSKQLFIVIPETVEFNPNDLRIGEVSVRNITSVTVNLSYNNQILTSFNNGSLIFSGTDISCGISQMYNLNDLMEFITRYVENRLSEDLNRLGIVNFTQANKDQIAKEIFKRYLEIVLDVNNLRTGLVLMSTNLNNHYLKEHYEDVLDSLCESAVDVINPNSNNPIRLWVFKLNGDE